MDVLIVIFEMNNCLFTLRECISNSESYEELQDRVNLNVITRKEEKEQYESRYENKDSSNYCFFNVAGLRYLKAKTKKLIAELVPGDILFLERDSDDEYNNMIKVTFFDIIKSDEILLGYVPADKTVSIGEIIDDNPQYQCYVNDISCSLSDNNISISAEIKY
ncbi:HIRAN domain-containing protein [Parabacteroides sp.]|uniref:HIRAN domain-containing protein n=1 Tax=Parabacteroides sp. TaxID=1869337 RepID=UPI00307FEC9A